MKWLLKNYCHESHKLNCRFYEKEDHHLKSFSDIIPGWIKNYDKSWLRPDVVAGLITSAIVLPKAMAYATIAGLPVQVGLYTVLIPMVIYAVTGTSTVLSVSTTTTLAILTAAELAQVAPGGDQETLIVASATLALLVGAMLVVASALRLGFIANFISEPVLIGFKGGIAMVIIMDQLPKIFGIHFEKGGFIDNGISIVTNLPHTHVPTLIVGLVMILLLIGFEKFTPKAPAPLIVVGLGIAAAAFLSLQNFGVELIGEIATGMPTFRMPNLSLIGSLWPGALGISLMSFTETIAAGRAFSKSGEPPVLANQELMATGLANAGGALFGAMPAGGGTSQTAVNRLAGAKSQFSKLVTAAMALLTLLVLAPVLGLMPQATLAAVVIVYSVGLFKPADFKAISTIRQTEFIWAVCALIGVVMLGTLKGILVSIVISMIALAQQTANPPVHYLVRKPGTNVFRPQTAEHPEDEEIPGLVILRPEGRIFFGNASRIGEKMRLIIAEQKPRVVVLEMSGVFDLEYTALKMLIEAEQRFRDEGIEIWMVDMNPAVYDIILRSSLGEVLTRKRMLFSLDIAVEKFREGN